MKHIIYYKYNILQRFSVYDIILISTNLHALEYFYYFFFEKPSPAFALFKRFASGNVFMSVVGTYYITRGTATIIILYDTHHRRTCYVLGRTQNE